MKNSIHYLSSFYHARLGTVDGLKAIKHFAIADPRNDEWIDKIGICFELLANERDGITLKECLPFLNSIDMYDYTYLESIKRFIMLYMY